MTCPMPVPHRIDVHVDEAYAHRVDAALLAAAIRCTLEARRLRLPRAVSLTFTDTRSVRRLNKRYRDLDEPTDVLSFNTDFPDLLRPDGGRELGALIIAVPVAARGARARSVTLADELCLLAVHGTLHLLGFDHEAPSEDAAMRDMERAALTRLGRPRAARPPQMEIPMPDAPEWTADDWDADWAGGTGGDGHPDPFLAAQLAGLAPGSALDLGCGDGVHSLWLAERGCRVLGVDWAKTAIARARRKAKQRGLDAEFRLADVTRWTPAETYDLVYSSWALPPRGPGRDHTLDLAASAVAPGGTLLLLDFDVSMEGVPGFPITPADLVSLDEIRPYLRGFTIQRAEVVEIVHTHDDAPPDPSLPPTRAAFVRAVRPPA